MQYPEVFLSMQFHHSYETHALSTHCQGFDESESDAKTSPGKPLPADVTAVPRTSGGLSSEMDVWRNTAHDKDVRRGGNSSTKTANRTPGNGRMCSSM